MPGQQHSLTFILRYKSMTETIKILEADDVEIIIQKLRDIQFHINNERNAGSLWAQEIIDFFTKPKIDLGHWRLRGGEVNHNGNGNGRKRVCVNCGDRFFAPPKVQAVICTDCKYGVKK